MPPQLKQHSRINLIELKSQIVKKLGTERANRYFNFLHRFLSGKVSKSEFDKLCCWTVGRENLPLHNQLIRSVLSNATSGVVPPPPPPPPPLPLPLVGKEIAAVSGKKEASERQNGPVSSSLWANGDVPVSPRKTRSVVRDRRIKDRFSPLGPNVKTLQQLSVVDELNGRNTLENGLSTQCDLDRPVHYQGFAERPVVHPGSTLLQPTNRGQSLSNDELHVQIEKRRDIQGAEDDMDHDMSIHISGSRSPIRAPLGIPFCPASIGGSFRALPRRSSSSFSYSVDTCELPDSETLKKRMEHIAGSEGLSGVSLDCANFLNHSLDVHLKNLIKSCVDRASVIADRETVKHVIYRDKPQGKVPNGAWLNHHEQTQRNLGAVVKDNRSPYQIALSDFKVAMELNPQQLGENWPFLYEKISFNCYEK